jgi:hypothetical protein
MEEMPGALVFLAVAGLILLVVVLTFSNLDRRK